MNRSRVLWYWVSLSRLHSHLLSISCCWWTHAQMKMFDSWRETKKFREKILKITIFPELFFLSRVNFTYTAGRPESLRIFSDAWQYIISYKIKSVFPWVCSSTIYTIWLMIYFRLKETSWFVDFLDRFMKIDVRNLFL